MKKIIFVHSLNNYSGSPNVLSVVIKGFVAKGYKTELITSHNEGFLSNIAGVKYRYTSYLWNKNRILTLIRLLYSQIEVFLIVLFISKKSILYLNTIIPFGAAWAAYLSGKQIIYHVHEDMCLNKALYAIYRLTYRCCNSKSIFVSHYLQNTACSCRDGIVIYNNLDSSFLEIAKQWMTYNKEYSKNTVLMVASLRKFKGIYNFVELARQLPEYSFELVLSATEFECETFRQETKPTKNVTVYPNQTNLHPFYQRARILLNLTFPDACIETFGLTILEAMVYGVPAIVPNVGGPTELVTDQINGYTLNPHNISLLVQKIQLLMSDEVLYERMSAGALDKSQVFSEHSMIDEIENYIIR